MSMSCASLFKSLEDQISVLMHVLREEHLQLHHVKPHGALYNLAAIDKEIAIVIVEVMKRFHLPIKLYVPYASVISKLAMEANIPIKYEAFADRNYNEDLTLVSRKKERALITEFDELFMHIKRIIFDKKVKSLSGVEVPIKADTFCIHGDHPKAIELVKKLSNKLRENNIKIQ